MGIEGLRQDQNSKGTTTTDENTERPVTIEELKKSVQKEKEEQEKLVQESEDSIDKAENILTGDDVNQCDGECKIKQNQIISDNKKIAGKANKVIKISEARVELLEKIEEIQAKELTESIEADTPEIKDLRETLDRALMCTLGEQSNEELVKTIENIKKAKLI